MTMEEAKARALVLSRIQRTMSCLKRSEAEEDSTNETAKILAKEHGANADALELLLVRVEVLRQFLDRAVRNDHTGLNGVSWQDAAKACLESM